MQVSCDVAVLGAGFAGSLTALILTRIGLKTALVDRSAHPRFAIGESSTPSANLVLRDLCARHRLTNIAPLAKYGTWRRAHPEVIRGPKRGFSYFQQRPHESFATGPDHARELLVAASSSLPTADTHWLRSDVDAFLVREAQAANVSYFDHLAVRVSRLPHGFQLDGERHGEPVSIEARFLIDGTGEAGLVLRTLGISQLSQPMETHSRALFGHFTGLTPWRDCLLAGGQDVADHPFDCDQSALHQVLDEGWMWQLRFDNGVTSAGFALDPRRCPADPALSADQEWSRLMQRYPSLAEQFQYAQLVAPAGGLCRTGRLQRRASRCAGENWAALPHTAGFIDPLHSSGIAHSLCGVERLTNILAEHWDRPSLAGALAAYDRIVLSEVDLIDQVVAACYEGLGCFDAFAACCMLYFAAATTFEHRRVHGQHSPEAAFLCADDPQFPAIVQSALTRGRDLVRDPQPSRVHDFVERTKADLGPFNRVGLFAPEVHNMYRHTAVPDGD